MLIDKYLEKLFLRPLASIKSKAFEVFLTSRWKKLTKINRKTLHLDLRKIKSCLLAFFAHRSLLSRLTTFSADRTVVLNNCDTFLTRNLFLAVFDIFS